MIIRVMIGSTYNISIFILATESMLLLLSADFFSKKSFRK